jgi:chloramphenicol 3-O-phosphotransferase
MKRLIAMLAFLLAGCTSSDEAIRALSAAGYTNIQITGYQFLGCDEKDTFHTGFVARGANGQAIEGVVCSGIFKGATIRTD